MNLLPDTSDSESEMFDVWVRIDIDALRDWPGYSDEDSRRFVHVNWPEACRIALRLVHEGTPHPPSSCLMGSTTPSLRPRASPPGIANHRRTPTDHRRRSPAIRFEVTRCSVLLSELPRCRNCPRHQGDACLQELTS